MQAFNFVKNIMFHFSFISVCCIGHKGDVTEDFLMQGGGFSPEPLDEPCRFFGLKLLWV